jgi:energy-coupling factor transporter ATP-binding protein EcfA2
MNTYEFITDKIDQDTNIIWFENSNKYIIVNDIVNNLILNKLSPSKYSLESESIKLLEKPKNQSIQEEINTLISDCNKTSKSKEIEEFYLTNFISKDYTKICFNNRVVKIEYENKKLKELIDPKFSHLNSYENEEITYRVCKIEKKIILFKEGKFIGSWNADEMHEFQGKVSMELTSFFHNKDESEWTCVFHGSTLSKKEKSIMLTGDSGSGKSSLSTILMDNNFSLVADDFSPMSIRGNHYNFPSAISIKEGFYKTANELYKINFESLKEYFVSEIKGNVKYLPPDNKNKIILKSSCNMVFNVKFGIDLQNEIKEVNKGAALNKILPDSWISNNMVHAKSFINWVKATNFYDLTYNNDEEIIKMINKII